MLLLALDTSTSAVTTALHDGNAVLAEATTVDPRAHGERLAPGVATVLASVGAAPGDLTHIVTGRGPGPFTGLRVGIVTARVLALATGAALHGLCSLDALAAAAAEADPTLTELLVATDARRKEVYWARYAVTPVLAMPAMTATPPLTAVTAPAAGCADSARGQADGAGSPGRLGPAVTPLDAPAVCRPGELPVEIAALPTAGRGPVLYPEVFARPVGPLDVPATALPRLAVARLAAGDRLAETAPLYLRRPDAAPHVAAKSALG